MKRLLIISGLAIYYSFLLSSCLNKEHVNKIVVKKSKIVKVERITLSKGKFQYFIISGKNFVFNSKEITFNIGDTIIVNDSIAYPKEKPNLIVNRI
jgi:hypothetical protein